MQTEEQKRGRPGNEAIALLRAIIVNSGIAWCFYSHEHFDLSLIFLCSLIPYLTLIPPPNNVANLNMYEA